MHGNYPHLRAIEGIGVIAEETDKGAYQVPTHLANAREHLQRHLPMCTLTEVGQEVIDTLEHCWLSAYLQ